MLFRYHAVDPLQVSMSCWMWSFNSSGSPSSVTKSKQHFSSCFRLSPVEKECWQRVFDESSFTPSTFPPQSLFVPPLPQQSPLFEHLDSPPWFFCSTFRPSMSSTISVTLDGGLCWAFLMSSTSLSSWVSNLCWRSVTDAKAGLPSSWTWHQHRTALWKEKTMWQWSQRRTQ